MRTNCFLIGIRMITFTQTLRISNKKHIQSGLCIRLRLFPYSLGLIKNVDTQTCCYSHARNVDVTSGSASRPKDSERAARGRSA